MNIKSQNKSGRRALTRNLIIIGAVIIVLIGGFLGYKYYKQANAPVTDPEMNLNPATDEEKAESNQHKEDIVKQQEKDNQPPSSTKEAVAPSIVDAGQYGSTIEVRSFVPGIYEANGTCTYTFTMGSNSVTKQATATQGATTTDCPPQKIARSEFAAAGTWNLVVSYSSTKHEGSSKPFTVEVK